MNPRQDKGSGNATSASTGSSSVVMPRLRAVTMQRTLEVCLAGIVALMAVVAAGAAMAQAMRGAQALQATDALVFQAAGRIIAAHGCVYCFAAERSSQLALLGGHLQANGVEAFNNPPLMAWLVQPFAKLSLSTYTLLSVLIEAAALVVGLFLAHRLLAGSIKARIALPVLALALVAPLPGLETLVFAQWVGLMLVALLGAYLLVRAKHAFAAGLALSVLLVKPQDIWLVPVVLIVARAWPMLFGLAVGAGVWLMTSVAVVSIGTLAHLTDALGQNQSQIPFTDGLPGVAAAIGGSGWAVIVAGLGIAVAFAMWPLHDRLRRDPMLALDIGIVPSLLFSPHVFSADLLLVGAVLVDVARRDLRLAVVGAVVLNVAYLLAAPLFHTGGHGQAVALVLVGVIVAVVASRRPHRKGTVVPADGITLVGQRQRSARNALGTPAP
jgi:Glycosyltransferase family 87